MARVEGLGWQGLRFKGLGSKLLVSPLKTPIVIPCIVPHMTPFKEFRQKYI